MTTDSFDICKIVGYHLWGNWGDPEVMPADDPGGALYQRRSCLACNLHQLQQVMDVTEGPQL